MGGSSRPFRLLEGLFPEKLPVFRPEEAERSWKREEADSGSLRIGSGRMREVRESLGGNSILDGVPNQVEAENELTAPTTVAQATLRRECKES